MFMCILFQRFLMLPCCGRIWFEISASPTSLNHFSCDACTDSTLSVGRQDSEGKDWPSYAEAKKMKSLILHTHGCLRYSLKDCSSSSITGYLLISAYFHTHSA